MGTGPFTFGEWVQGDHFSANKNKNYWQSGRPYLDGVHVAIIKDPSALTAAFEGGQLDVAQTGLSLRDFARLKADTAHYHDFANIISTGYSIVGMNTRNAPFSDKRVRQAMDAAMDRQRFVDTQLIGLATPMSLPWQSSSPAYDPTKKVAFDLDKAKSLLAAAGASNITFDMLLGPGGDGPTFAQIYQGDLAKIGATMNIKNLDLASWLDQVNNKKYSGLYWIPSASAASPGAELGTSRGWDPNENNSGYSNADYTKLVTALNSETDPAKLKTLYGQVNDFLLDDPFAFPIANTVPTSLARNNVQGTAIRFLAGWALVDAWLQ
jgi:peptide/nickel transport system substrate-binding protein